MRLIGSISFETDSTRTQAPDEGQEPTAPCAPRLLAPLVSSMAI